MRLGIQRLAPPAEHAPRAAVFRAVEGTARRRLLIANSAIVVVIALMAVTAVMSLRATSHQLEEARQIDRRLALIDRLRAETRELGFSARRYMLGGDLKEQQRVLAIVHDMRREREVLNARASLAKGALFEAELDEFIASLMNAMTFDDEEPIVRVSRFEDELARIRGPLAMMFDDIVSRERTRRADLRSAHSFARIAQWAVGIAGLLGAVLIGISTITGLRRPRGATNDDVVRSRHELVAAATELRAPLEHIVADSSQLRIRERDPAVARVLDNIARNASRVNGMLAELLDVSAIQTGTTALRREPLDGAQLVDRAIKDHREAAHARGIRLRYEAQLSITLFADRERIRHVLDSLLQLAIASARTPAELVVHVAAAEGGTRFAIIEPGPGTDSNDGQELALHLCKRVVEAHGGRLGIQTSSISRTYWFTLPSEPSLLR